MMNDFSFSIAESKNSIPTLHDQLKLETRQDHQDLERCLDLLRPDFTLEEYQRLVVKFYKFHLAFEDYLNEIAALKFSSAVFYGNRHSKLNWLAEDIKMLGVHEVKSECLFSTTPFSQSFPSSEHIWGAIYVIEGSTLGGTILSKHFMKTLGITSFTGTRFFSGYGEQTKKKWHETLQHLSAYGNDQVSHADIIIGAKRMFALLKQCLTDS